MDSLSDNSLMLKVKSGDTQKLGLLYERYKKRLFGFFYQMNHDITLSEDLVQNVFMRVLKYKHTYTEKSNFVSWIFHIARNVNHDHFRKNKNNRYAVEISEISERLNSQVDIHEQIVSLENTSLLKRALQKLSIEKREVIVLSKLKELKCKQIGEIIGCSEGAARTKVYRALSDLKEKFLELEKR